VIEMKKRPDNPGARNAAIAAAIVLGSIAFFAGGWVVIPMFLAVVGTLLAVLTVAVLLGAPFLVVGFGIYGMTRLAKQRRAAVPAVPTPAAAAAHVPYQLVPPQTVPVPPPPAPAPAVVARPAAPPAPARHAVPHADLPATVRAKVQRTERRARELLDRGGPSAISQEDRVLVQRTLQDYLPHALRAYRALPPGSGEWAVTADGKTGAQLLEEQLDLIEESLRQIEVRIWRSGAERMLAQQRFLEERFGTTANSDEGGDDELRLPPKK
jgi:hypothetical protein